MKPKIEAVIFDADGTILDTRELVISAYRHVFTEHGYQMPTLAELAPFAGSRTQETYRHFATGHDPSELHDKHHEFQQAHIDLFDAYEGFYELMQTLKKADIKIGICTNRGENVMELLQHIDVGQYFDAIIHADLMEHHKPHPDGIFKLCKLLKVEPARSVMVGDTDADIGAGKAAGCAFTIGITHGIGTREMLKETGADHIVDHLNDILPIVI